MSWVIGTPAHVGENSVSLAVGPQTLELSAHAQDGSTKPLSPSLHAFLPIAILLATEKGEDLHVDADVEDGYFAGLNLGLGPFCQALYGGRAPKLTRRARAEAASMASGPGKSALLFSGGVDSFYSLKQLIDQGIRPDYLLNVSAGGHKTLGAQQTRTHNVGRVADQLDMPLLQIDTNFHDVFRMDHSYCAAIRNISASLALYPEVSTFYYSSASNFQTASFESAQLYRGLHYVEQYAIPYILPPGARIIMVGLNATRIEKTKAIAEWPLSHANLDVCVNARYQAQRSPGQPLNCGKCTKCARTILTLQHFGLLDRFEAQFDLSTFRSSPRALLRKLEDHPEILNDEVTGLVRRDATLYRILRGWFDR
jgi:hypothetical protein